MKVTRIIIQELELDLNLEIAEATLLTAEKARRLPERLRKYDDWWLKSPSDVFDFRYPRNDFRYIKSVGCDGVIFPNLVDDDTTVVRPVLIISNFESSNLKIGDRFEFGGKEFEIVFDCLAFCLEDIGECVFRKDYNTDDANDYEKSDIKKYIDDWFKKVKETEE